MRLFLRVSTACYRMPAVEAIWKASPGSKARFARQRPQQRHARGSRGPSFRARRARRLDARAGRGLCGPARRRAVQGRPVQPDLQAGHARTQLCAAPQAAGPAAPRRPCGRPRISRDYRARDPGLSGRTNLRPVHGRERDRHRFLRDGDGRGPDLLGSGLPGRARRRAPGLFRRNERHAGRAPHDRPRGGGTRRLWQARQLFRPPDRALVEAIFRGRGGGPDRGDGPARRMAARAHPATTSRNRASSTATFAATT